MSRNTNLRVMIRAIFKGSNGSLGYRTGRTYNLTVEVLPNNRILILPESAKPSNPSPCGYSNLSTFFNNWKDINKL